MSDTLSINDDVMFLSCFTACDDVVDQFLLVVVVFLRDQNVLCTVCDTAPHSKVSCITSHNLDDTASLMRSRSITNFVDCFHSCVNCCIESDCILCTSDIQVNCTRNTDSVDTKISQLLCTCKRTVSTDNYQSIDSMFLTDLSTSLLSFRCTELCTSCCVKNCTASFDCIRYVSGSHINDFFIQKTVVSFINTFDIKSAAETSSYNCTNCSVHSWSITTTCEYADGFYLFLCHDSFLHLQIPI